MGVPAWKALPSWFLVADGDQTIPPDAERLFARRMGATTVEVPTNHVAMVSQGILDQFWLWSIQAGLKNAYESIKAFSETDFTEDLKKFDVPTLVMHGEDDQIVPVKDSAKKSARLIKGAKEIYYPGAPHGLTATLQDQVNADLLAFLKS